MSQIPIIVMTISIVVLVALAMSHARGIARDLTFQQERVFAGCCMEILVSLIVIGSALWVILSGHYSNDTQKWAFGAIGTVVGRWIGHGHIPHSNSEPPQFTPDPN